MAAVKRKLTAPRTRKQRENAGKPIPKARKPRVTKPKQTDIVLPLPGQDYDSLASAGSINKAGVVFVCIVAAIVIVTAACLLK